MDAHQTADTGPAPPKRRLLAYLVLPGLFFLLGIAAMAWILSQWDYAARMIGVAPEAAVAVYAHCVMFWLGNDTR